MSLYKKTKNTRNTTKKIVMVAMLLFLIGILVIATNPEMGNIFISTNDPAKTNQTGSFSVKIIATPAKAKRRNVNNVVMLAKKMNAMSGFIGMKSEEKVTR